MFGAKCKFLILTKALYKSLKFLQKNYQTYFEHVSDNAEEKIMFYHLRDHIYVTQFRDELILLDTKRDKYMICFQQLAELLLGLLDEKQKSSITLSSSSSKSKHISPEDFSTIETLLNDQIVEEKEIPFPFHIDLKPNSDGVSNVNWSLPLENKKVSLNFSVLKALLTLIKVNLYIKVRGFYSTIQLIKKAKKNNKAYIVPFMEELWDLANIVNKACLIYPSRTKCLEWAATFVLLALKRGWKCNLEVGVQNYPFMAHAWVECDGQVVMDSQELREGLGIILNEPFRKVKI